MRVRLGEPNLAAAVLLRKRARRGPAVRCGMRVVADLFETRRKGLVRGALTGIDLQDGLIPADRVRVLAASLEIPANFVAKRYIPGPVGNRMLEVGEALLLA